MLKRLAIVAVGLALAAPASAGVSVSAGRSSGFSAPRVSTTSAPRVTTSSPARPTTPAYRPNTYTYSGASALRPPVVRSVAPVQNVWLTWFWLGMLMSHEHHYEVHRVVRVVPHCVMEEHGQVCEDKEEVTEEDLTK